ncbi:YafY family transcriptional regulator [Actinomadura sp. PM05-2]|uniref:YafY family transcriptional regulator n=2 Tax=Actinomadura parmotrematis TaxID=2864039 RepID=A0ABS7FQR3_9ACTN|nr:YafY family transcriptional regulator [Actinomadura parmotrematis]
MLELLQTHHRLTGPDLAARLGVDERTVRRYAARLDDLGIPVTADRGRHGGYRLSPGYRLPPLMLTGDEATAVVLALLAGRRLGLPAAPAESAHAKIARVLPAALRDRVQALQDTLGFTLDARDGTDPAPGVLLTLATAARTRRRTRLAYRSWKGERTERDLDPHGLVFHAGRWYVTGHDHRSAATRTFRLDRVHSADLLDTAFDDPGDTDPVGHLTRSLAAVPYAHRVRVLLHTDPATARRRIPATVATLHAEDGGTLLDMRVEHLADAARMLAGLGHPFTVREPAALRDAVRDLAAHLTTQADRP